MENPPVSQPINERQSASWDVQNAPKNYLSLVISQAASAFFAFGSVWLITRSLGSEKYGGVAAVIAASQIVQVLINWTILAVVRFGVEEFIETEKITRTFWHRLLILLPNLALVLAASNFWFPPLADWLKLPPETFWLIFLHFVVAVLWSHLQYSLQAAKRITFQGWLVTVERILIFASVLILALIGKLDWVTAVISYTVAPLIALTISVWILRGLIFARFVADWIFLRKILIFSLPLFPFVITNYLSSGYADALFISKFLSTKDLGVYSVATQINGVTLQLPALFNSLLVPLFVSLQKESQTQKTRQYFSHLLPTLTLFWGLFSGISSFAAYFLLPVIFGEEFSATSEIFWILFTNSTLIFPLLAGYGALSNSSSATYIPMICAILAGLTNVGFNLLLIPTFGMLGCAWATAFMNLVYSLSLAILLRGKTGMPISWTFIAPIPAVACALVFSYTKSPFWALLPLAIITAFIFIAQLESFKITLTFLKRYKLGK